MTSLSQGLAIAGGGGGGGGGGAPTPPGGVTTEIQFNDAGAFAGTAELTFEKVQKVLILNKLAALTPAALQQIIADWGPSLIAAGVYDTTNPASFPDYSSAIFASPVVTNAPDVAGGAGNFGYQITPTTVAARSFTMDLMKYRSVALVR